jgi:hypothetical protein
VDEARPTAQPPLIMAPANLKIDPEGEAPDAIVDNGIMSASRKRTEQSPSVTSRQPAETDAQPDVPADAAASADSPPLPTATAVAETEAMPVVSEQDAPSAAAEPTGVRSSQSVPLPAETIGKLKGKTADSSGSTSAGTAGADGQRSKRQGSWQPVTAGESAWSTSQETAVVASAESADLAEHDEPAPSFTPSSSTSSSATPPPSYSPPPSYATQGSYPRSDWASGAEGKSSVGAEATGAGYTAGFAPTSGQTAAGWRGPQVRKSSRRQAMLTLSRVEPWSVMKFSFIASGVAFIVLFVAVAVLYMVLSALGVLDSLQHTVSSITSSQSTAGTNIAHWFSASRVLSYTAMLGLLNIVLITAIATVGSVIYNLIAKAFGGIEVTLRETD